MDGENILYIWEEPAGTVWWWMGPDVNPTQPFFFFGRYGSGLRLFKRINDDMCAEAQLATIRAKEKYGKDTQIIFAKPEGLNDESM